jgi:hypothetical protein
MLINPFLFLLIVILRCCKNDSSAINLIYSEQQLFSHKGLESTLKATHGKVLHSIMSGKKRALTKNLNIGNCEFSEKKIYNIGLWSTSLKQISHLFDRR